ncbi:MAG: hypothetical protein JWO31_4312 [Phycisphaerales bacterium]|nr:hypothetical protein [Phycisphaerales bacterium]
MLRERAGGDKACRQWARMTKRGGENGVVPFSPPRFVIRASPFRGGSTHAAFASAGPPVAAGTAAASAAGSRTRLIPSIAAIL